MQPDINLLEPHALMRAPSEACLDMFLRRTCGQIAHSQQAHSVRVMLFTNADAPDIGPSKDVLSDGSHQASTGSPAGAAAGFRAPTGPSSPHGPSATQQSAAAVTVGHGETMRDDSAQLGSASVQGQHGQQVPGLRASLALDSLREVAAGQRHGRLITPRTSAEGALPNQAQPHNADAAAQTADGLHAMSCGTGSEGVVCHSAGGEEADSAENPQAEHIVGTAAASGGAEHEAATEETPASPVQPARPAHGAPGGNPFASPVPAQKQALRNTAESGAPPEGDASLGGHGVEALLAAVAGLGLGEGAPDAGAVLSAADLPAGGGTPAAKRGRFAPRYEVV